MSRTLSILILVIALLGAFLLFRNVPDSNKEGKSASEFPNLSKDKSRAVLDDSHYENWKEFTSQTGNFKVLLPILPQHATDKILDPQTKETRKYDMYVAANDAGTVFMISAIT